MNAENINQILDALAQRFGATGAALWQAIVTAQRVEIVVWCAAAVTFFVLAALMYRAGLAHLATRAATVWKRYEGGADGARDESSVFRLWMAGAVGFLVVVLMLFFPYQELLNPQYAALVDILNRLSPR